VRRLILYIVLIYSALIVSRFPIESTERETVESETEAKTDRPLGFLEFHSGIRTRDGDSGPRYRSGYKWKALREAVEANKRRNSTSARANSDNILGFKERGPGNVPGRTRAVFNVPGDPLNKTWLAGSATGGIWRTTDGGATWSERSSNFPALPISSFSSDRTGSVIYAGTGESVSSFYSAIGNGIFKSTDKGVTWTQLPSTNNHPDFSIVTRVISDPDNPNTILASTVPHNLTTDNTSAIMRSTDGGLNWTKVKEVEGIFEQVTFTPSNFKIQYACENGVGVWKSTDAGLTWNLSNKGMSPDGRIEICVSPSNSNFIFASAEGTLSGTGSDLYHSSDGGLTWSLVDMRFNDQVVDFFDGQGFYNNTILCDPFNSKSFYVGGVSLFKTTLSSGSTSINNYKLIESGTDPFLFLQSFGGIPYDHQRLNTGPKASKDKIEIQFGPGLKQKAHRFLVPVNRTNGLTAEEYNFASYVDVPFQVWNVTKNKQLMVSFRDQNRNGKFDLVPSYLTNDGIDYLQNSREYVYIHDVSYATVPNSSIAQNAGHEFNLMYNFFPALQENAAWNETALPASKLIIEYSGLLKLNASTVTVADGRGTYDNKNKSNQVELSNGVHPDHHSLAAIIESVTAKTYKLLLGNDGGVFISKTSTSPGTTEGDWEFKGLGFNTGQFYGADKRPGEEQYIGGLQDNGTRISPRTELPGPLTEYLYAVDGDGFEVLWNSKHALNILATRYNGQIAKSTNGGISWKNVASGSNDSYPFVTKLANSKDYPDRVFTVGAKGVYRSENFGDSWELTAIPSKFVIGTSFFLDVEVSRANANIVWAGSGMNSTDNIRHLFVSTNGGKSFATVKNFTDVTLGNITKLASHPTEPNTAYALFSFANSPKILRTTDLGQTWQDISGFGTGSSSTNGFPDVAVFCLYVRTDNPNIIWVGTEIGIVESTDGGQTWALMEDFPKVSVWEMKGQDNEVVIATHGRGIWTATLENLQTSSNIPEIITAGSSPKGNFVLRIRTHEYYDSVRIIVNGTNAKTLKQLDAQVSDISINSGVPEKKEVKVVGYKQAAPYQSMVVTATHHAILNARNAYTTYFRSLDDLVVNGMTMQYLDGASRPFYQSLQTNHYYTSGENYEVFIKTPVTFSAGFPRIMYKDIAIVEPGDSIVVEVTKNGLDWITLTSYDATLNPAWHAAYQENKRGTGTMYVQHDLDYSSHFATGDLLLFRLRLVSNTSVTSWGWAIEQISIQEIPTSTEGPDEMRAEIFPNPTSGLVQIEYTVEKPSPVTVDVINIFGSKVNSVNFGNKSPGTYTGVIDLSKHAVGTYILLIQTSEHQLVKKIIRRD
jgi:photosystem II stability/assembly factor-like uncharacterized protein